ncbi:NTP transferase domain-containing protein [Spongiimicrobium sp. 3-5]|uniref:NTP transferase domain-containing protein n=1 Tax=Spongiimicrobium sp. 3-5 TaxID=3332596 RepID=UPI0039808BAB
MINKIYGLVLSGGKSTRMGTDKGAIMYHGIPQREHLYKLLAQVCDKTFLSIREDQQGELPKDMEYIVDRNEYKGPYNGLLSAHKQHPHVAWLVLACDLPLMDENALAQLLRARDNSKLATAFALRADPLPEPLCAIWEAKGLQRSIDYLKEGVGTCPRKFLINSDIALVYPDREEVLLNANSESEYKEALLRLNIQIEESNA